MTLSQVAAIGGGLIAAAVLAQVFLLYRDPMLEIYLADWGLC